MKDITSQQAVVRYYERFGSRLGYRLVMKRSKHFGYYDASHTTERAAQRRFHEKVAELLDLKPGLRVLDAGSGLGVVATYLAKTQDVHVTGITLVPHEVIFARKRAHKQCVGDKTAFQIADYAKTPFPDASFDRIYTTETLSHAPDVQTTLQEFHRLLKPGGKIVCIEYELDYDRFTDEEAEPYRFWVQYWALHGLTQFNRGKFLKLIRAAMFSEIHEHDWTNAVLPSFYRLYRLARPAAPLVAGLVSKGYFVNTVAAKGYYLGAKAGKFWFKAYTATKLK